jgi:hypothetical protein
MRQSDLVILFPVLLAGYWLFVAIQDGGARNWAFAAIMIFGAGVFLWLRFQNRDNMP